MPSTELKDGLSVVIIARNEENNAARSLRNIKELADEIVFVDTGSHDSTIEIARKFGCRIFEFPWVDDFSRAKNFGIEQATYSWILNIDCDEVLYDKKAKSLLQVAMRENNKPAYIIWQDNLYDTGRIGQVGVMRLFRNNAHIRFQGPVHESICNSIYHHWPDYEPEQLDIHLRHYGHMSRHAVGKHERNIRILQKWVGLEPDNIYTNYKLAKTLNETGETGAMLPYLEKTFALFCDEQDRSTYPFIKDFLTFYYKVLLENGLHEKAEKVKDVVETWGKESGN